MLSVEKYCEEYTMSPELEQEIQRRLAAGPFKTKEELISRAFQALDNARAAAQEMVELELLKGLDGEDIELTSVVWDEIEREALQILEAKNRK